MRKSPIGGCRVYSKKEDVYSTTGNICTNMHLFRYMNTLQITCMCSERVTYYFLTVATGSSSHCGKRPEISISASDKRPSSLTWNFVLRPTVTVTFKRTEYIDNSPC